MVVSGSHYPVTTVIHTQPRTLSQKNNSVILCGEDLWLGSPCSYHTIVYGKLYNSHHCLATVSFRKLIFRTPLHYQEKKLGHYCSYLPSTRLRCRLEWSHLRIGSPQPVICLHTYGYGIAITGCSGWHHVAVSDCTRPGLEL